MAPRSWSRSTSRSIAGRSDPRPRGPSSRARAIRASGCGSPGSWRGLYERAARGLREREQVVREAVPRGARATRRSATSSSCLAAIVDHWGSSRRRTSSTRRRTGRSPDLRDVAIRGGADLRPPPQQPRPRICGYRRALAIQATTRSRTKARAGPPARGAARAAQKWPSSSRSYDEP